MEYQDVIARRRMYRNFRDDPLPDGAVERIARSGLRAPSAGFTQGFCLLVLTGDADRTRFWTAAGSNPQPDSVRAAPLVIVPFASKDAYLDRYAEPDKGWTDRDEARWPVPYWYIDAGFSALLVLLAAVDEGLGALFIGLPREDWPTLRGAFDVPEAYDPIGAITVGHVAGDPQSDAIRRRRRAPTDLLHFGRWGEAA